MDNIPDASVAHDPVAAKLEAALDVSVEEKPALSNGRSDPTSPMTEPSDAAAAVVIDRANDREDSVGEAVPRAMADKEEPALLKAKHRRRNSGCENLKCMLCGATTEGVQGRNQTIKRLYYPTLAKFAKIPVMNNPFAAIDIDDPPDDLAICHNDRVWINNLWINGKRYSLPGIWTRRTEDGLAGKPTGRGRRKTTPSRPSSVQDSGTQVARLPKKLSHSSAEGDLAVRTPLVQVVQAPLGIAGRDPEPRYASTGSEGTDDRAHLKRARGAQARQARWLDARQDFAGNDLDQTDDDESEDAAMPTHTVLKKTRPNFQACPSEPDASEAPMNTEEQLASLRGQNSSLRREILELRTVVEDNSTQIRVLDAAVRNLLNHPRDSSC